MALKVTELAMTCSACPSQWEGKVEDGRHLYVRYRWGGLSCGVGPTFDDAVGAGWKDNEDGELLFAAQIGGAYDGVMSTEEMLGYLKDHIYREGGP